MPLDPEILAEIAQRTVVLRPPKQKLATFGTTMITYYLLTEPAYAEVLPSGDETVVREGKVTVQRPQIITPYYLLNLFRGFEHGEEYAQYLLQQHGPNSPGLMYTYRNDLQETSVVSDPLPAVAGRLTADLDERGESLAVVMRGVDHLWDVSLMKFMYEMTASSVGHNVAELGRRGLLESERGLPRAARARIEEMFAAVQSGDLDPRDLKAELDRWGVFEEYEDHFLGLFRKR
ncbi:MAG: hypothetical protein M0Z94_12235 [Dehalococcoidales bacterium]|nr:hypothetical protein [Dehalococcoidales bacterium]